MGAILSVPVFKLKAVHQILVGDEEDQRRKSVIGESKQKDD